VEGNNKIKFIDLFAGIGGFHLALHHLGAVCVFASERDEHARETYEFNFKDKSPELFKKGNFVGDITEVDKDDIPDFDILTAGFPCQPFSQAGLKRGFDDVRGTLFFDIAKIIQKKRPQAYFLENVRNLYSHDEGRTFARIKDVLTKKLGYSFQEFIVKASDHGLPQHRQRLFMIGFKDNEKSIIRPKKEKKLKLTMSDVMGGKVDRDIGYTLRVGGRASGIGDRRNWDCYEVDGEKCQLNPCQGKKMQGFPRDFKFPDSVSVSSRMKQLGNSVAVPAVEAYAKEILQVIG
tara:strand:+ start:238 stop:1110 length:873 start_codon:yes stop_codon:yes gene_type:complete